MKKLVYAFILSAILAAILISCSFPGGSEGGESNLPVVQATTTMTITEMVNIELTVQYDNTIVYNAVGQPVKFKFIVKMNRNDSVGIPANLTITGATATCPPITQVGNLNDRLDAGEAIECTADYAITQADLDKGSIMNTAVASAYTVNSNQVITTVPAVPARAITLTKAADPASYYQAGQTIKFNYTIKNSGSSALGPAQFTVADSGINNNTAFNCGNADATLAPGATLSCSANYTVTATDAAATSISTNATAAGGGANPSQTATAVVTKTTAPVIASGTTVQHTVLKGEWLWQIARCYGADPAKTVSANPQLSDPAQLKAGMVVNVPNIGSNGSVHAPPQPCVTLHIVQSGDTWSSIASKYGADAGFTQYVNSNTLTVGKEVKVPQYTAGMNYPIANATTTSTPTTPSSTALGLTVSAAPNTYSQAGQVVTYTYVIKNNGATTLGPAQFTVTDVLISATAFNCGASATLAPGTTTTCTASYTISQPDMSAVSISNSATASGGGAPTSAAASTTINKSVTLLTLTVSASPTTYSQAGQAITYTYVIKNSGTVALGPAPFIVNDPLASPAPINCGTATTNLAPGATTTCTATYTITAEDMGAASISNSATATGGGAPASQPASVTITRQ